MFGRKKERWNLSKILQEKSIVATKIIKKVTSRIVFYWLLVAASAQIRKRSNQNFFNVCMKYYYISIPKTWLIYVHSVVHGRLCFWSKDRQLHNFYFGFSKLFRTKIFFFGSMKKEKQRSFHFILIQNSNANFRLLKKATLIIKLWDSKITYFSSQVGAKCLGLYMWINFLHKYFQLIFLIQKTNTKCTKKKLVQKWFPT